MNRAINYTSLTLIPKNDHPVTVKEYRSIAGCTVLNKIISKVLASRLQKVIASVVCEAQAEFIPSRKISDNIFLAQELVKSYTRMNISPRCMIKIDLQKAYDSVEWIFLEQVLDELGFPRQFTMYILECVKTVNYSILVNGKPTAPFDATKGLRQGDPISPFLFALAMEYLNDLLLFSRGDVESVSILNRCFLDFSSASGLQANKETSSIYFGGVTQIIQDQILHLLGFPKGELPFKYLGIPLSTKKISLLQWKPLINKMVARISSWIAKKLSYAGRSQLIQTVLFSIQAYWSQLFSIPSKVLSTIEAYCRSYLWSGTNTITRKALNAWDKVCTPKSMGSLGLLNIRLWNKAAIAKASWDIENKADRLWIGWLDAYYIKNQQFSQMSIPQQARWMVRKIFEARDTVAVIQDIKTGSLIKQSYLKLIGDNERTTWKTLRFGNDARPKAQFTVWLQMHGKLMTVDRLASWGINVDPICNLYNSHNEIRNHVFMECPFSSKVWEGVLKWVQVPLFRTSQWEQMEKWIIKASKGKSHRAQIFKLAYTEWVHTMRIERNQRRFEKIAKSLSQLVREIAYVCNIRASTRIKKLVQQLSI
ncbi:PREDICTED: uncharacterized protein LOC109244828 [Nicotiana attenuata]|uniref:uncharacterized protein LOC109244828 n=1 Tax=Nicotiana attenuata TaxID=49451 RepID=UPI000904D8EE|nr:PREDICTED: uncharacterized protein LOC109244828 [Nicotiana attenuata]